MHVFPGDEDSNYVIGGFPLDLANIQPYQDEIKRDFSFNPKVSKAAQDYLHDIRRQHEDEQKKKESEKKTKGNNNRDEQMSSSSSSSSPLVFVGIHVRRTDYSVWLERRLRGQLVSKRFFVRYNKRKY